jgi:UDP-N-acetylmuramate--alanine ligase
VTNIEPDHLDIYGTVEEMTAAFAQFMASAPIDGHVIACADSPRVRQTVAAGGIEARDVQTYGIDGPADWRASGVTQHESGQSFDVGRDGRPFGTFTIGLPGRHNVSNALAGIAAGARSASSGSHAVSTRHLSRSAAIRVRGRGRGRDGDG